MKKILLITAVLAAVVLAGKAFAAEVAATTENKPVVAATTTPVKATTPTYVALNGTITGMEATTLKVKDNANKEWAFKVGTVDCKSYKVGDNVTVNYEKDNLKSIAKWTK